MLQTLSHPYTRHPKSLKSLEITWVVAFFMMMASKPCFTALASNDLSVASGHYTSATFPSLQYPLLFISTDGGLTWANKMNSSPSLLPNDFAGNGVFNSTSCHQNTCIAAGQYASTDHINYPLLALSTDNGITWTYVISRNPNDPTVLPIDFGNNGIFNSARCFGSICITIGQYEPNTAIPGQFFPLLALSTNMGKSWTYALFNKQTLPPNFGGFGKLVSASCTDKACVAVGSYYSSTTPSVQYPLLVMTQNGGMTWTFDLSGDNTSQVSLPSDFGNFGKFVSTSSHLNTFIAAGSYRSQTNPAIKYPLLAVSSNNGSTWIYEISSSKTSQTPLPSDYSGLGAVMTTSCSNTNCIAAGSYVGTGGIQYPLLANTTDGGLSWFFEIASFPYGSNTLLPNDYQNKGLLSSTSSNDTVSIAAGSYLSTDGNRYPLLATSTNHGLTWAYEISSPETSSTLLPSDYRTGGNLVTVSCNGTYCIAAGYYQSIDSKIVPLLFSSTNSGVTWSYKISSATPLPTDFGNVGLFSGEYFSQADSFPGSLKFLNEPDQVINLLSEPTP